MKGWPDEPVGLRLTARTQAPFFMALRGTFFNRRT
jgi:hypothetical protein